MSRVFSTSTIAMPSSIDAMASSSAAPAHGYEYGNGGGKGISFPAVKTAGSRDTVPTSTLHSNIQSIKASFGLSLPGALASTPSSTGRVLSLKQLLAVQRARALLDQCAHLRESALCRQQQIPPGVRDADLDSLIEALAPMDTLQLLVEQQEAVCGPMSSPSSDHQARRLQGYAQFQNDAPNGGPSSPRQRARKLAPIDVALANANAGEGGIITPQSPGKGGNPPQSPGKGGYPASERVSCPGRVDGVQPSPPQSPLPNRTLDSLLSPRRVVPHVSVSMGSGADSIVFNSQGRLYRSISSDRMGALPSPPELSLAGKKPLPSPRRMSRELSGLSPSSSSPTTPRTPLSGGDDRLQDLVVPSPPRTPRRTLLGPYAPAPQSPLRADVLTQGPTDALADDAAVLNYILSWREGMLDEPEDEGKGEDEEGGWLLPPLEPILDTVWDHDEDDISGLRTPPEPAGEGAGTGGALVPPSRTISAVMLPEGIDWILGKAGGDAEDSNGDGGSTPATTLQERFPKEFFDLQWLDEMKCRIDKRLATLEEALATLQHKKSRGNLSWDDADREGSLTNEIHLLTRNREDMLPSLQRFPDNLHSLLVAYKRHMGLMGQLEEMERRHDASAGGASTDADELPLVTAAKKLETQLVTSLQSVQAALDVYYSSLPQASK
eukprot:jgi/Mesvir1/23809/Mv10622-RA.1